MARAVRKEQARIEHPMTSERNPYAPPTVNVSPVRPAPGEGAEEEAPFFAVSIIKLSVMSVCTFGVYEVYWFYKNWQLIKTRREPYIMPFWRAIFAVFFCYQCFSRIREYDHPTVSLSSLAAGPLATGWIVLTALWRLPAPYGLISFFAFLFLLPVQHRVNEINSAVAPDHDPNAAFSWLNWIAVAVGAILLLLTLVGAIIQYR